jgi:hypothetical protein
MSIEFLGIVQVPLLQLQYREGLGQRAYDSSHTDDLIDLFNGTSIDHENADHRIDGFVNTSDVPIVLGRLKMSKMQLIQTLLGQIRPQLKDFTVWYTHGRHRIEAAKVLDPSSSWTVNLFSTDLAKLGYIKAVRQKTEQYKHERRYSDGHIYCKIREYEIAEDVESLRVWTHRWSCWKQEVYDTIRSRPRVYRALDKLKDFQGVIEELQLSNYSKYAALHIEDSVEKCIQHIYEYYSNVAGQDPIRYHFDIQTTKELEGRAPMASEFDRKLIRSAFRAKGVLSGVKDLELRSEIEQRVLTIPGIIPGLRYLQNNMKCLCIAAEILWTLLVPKESRKAAKKRVSRDGEEGKSRTPLSGILRQFWNPETQPFVEVREGEFQPTIGAPSFELVYNQLVLAALRQFPLLLGVRPRIERGKGSPAKVDKACRALFYRRASFLGLRNELIDQELSGPARPFAAYSGADNLGGEGLNLNQVDRRWGKPCARMLQQIQKVGFLPQLAECPLASDEISVSFLLKDFTQTFLVYSEVSLDYSRPPVFINLPHNSQSLGMFPQSAPGHGGTRYKPTLSQDVQMDDVWSEGEDVIMQDYVPVAADITTDEPTSRALASSVQTTTKTQSELSRQVALYSKVFAGQPMRQSPHITRQNIFRPRHARDQRMRRLIVDRHVRSITPRYDSISPLQDPNQMQREHNSGPPLRSDDANIHQQLGVTLSQTVHRDSIDSSIGHNRSTIPTPEAVPSSQNSVWQHSGSVTPTSGLLEDTEAPSFSAAGSETYSRSVIPSPPQYISSFVEHRSPASPPSMNTASPFQTHRSSVSSSHIRPRSMRPTPSPYSLQSITPPSLLRSETSLSQNESFFGEDRPLPILHNSQNPAVSPSTTASIGPRSTCPTPPIFQESKRSHPAEEGTTYGEYRRRDRYSSGWQGFEDSDEDDLVSGAH